MLKYWGEVIKWSYKTKLGYIQILAAGVIFFMGLVDFFYFKNYLIASFEGLIVLYTLGNIQSGYIIDRLSKANDAAIKVADNLARLASMQDKLTKNQQIIINELSGQLRRHGIKPIYGDQQDQK